MNYLQPLGRRRNNFYGLHLIAMTEHEPPFSFIDSSYETEAKFFQENETYDVTSYLRPGMYTNLFQNIALNLNFTVTYYKRKDGSFGSFDGNKTTGKKCSATVFNTQNNILITFQE